VSINEIPLRVVGPGSQPQDKEQLSYIDMPGQMERYSPPYVPDLDAVRKLDGARAAMQWLRQALADYSIESDPLIANLSALDQQSRELVNQILGEGEVSVQDIVENVGTSQSNISQHLAILRDKDILATRKDANRVYYKISDPRLLQLIGMMREVFCTRHD